MCSVSWLITPEGYQVFFNRDEQKTRPLAYPPLQQTLAGVEVLMPIDPTSDGSWISLNEMGLSLCLLNNYQGKTSSAPLISRGQLLKSLSNALNVAQVAAQFDRLSLKQFAPFTLLAFDGQLCSSYGEVMAFEWDGEQAQIYPTNSPLFSSAVDLERVQDYRLNAYQKHLGAAQTLENFIAFHRDHSADESHLSVCMHRHDAHTVSFTHLQVSQKHKEMAYVSGSPCLALSKKTLNSNCYSLTHTANAVLL